MEESQVGFWVEREEAMEMGAEFVGRGVRGGI
jgi:hypothetical protein